MGHSAAGKRAHHERIVDVAAARFRESGVDAVGVADLMDTAGLTHGGFYRHFASREELVGEAVERALRQGGGAMEDVARSSEDPLAAVIEAYLSAAHRDGLATSCAVASLAGDVTRGSDRARAAYTRQVLAYVELLSRLLPSDLAAPRRATAITALATLVGAISMARATNDPILSNEILATVAAALKEGLSLGPEREEPDARGRRPRRRAKSIRQPSVE